MCLDNEMKIIDTFNIRFGHCKKSTYMNSKIDFGNT